MASLAQALNAIRRADRTERVRQLQTLRDTFVPPDVPDPLLQGLLDDIRSRNRGSRQQLLDEMLERYIEDNPDPDKSSSSRKDRSKRNLQSFLLTERNAGRVRPSRRVIENRVRREERVSQRQLDADLVDTYDAIVAIGLVAPRA